MDVRMMTVITTEMGVVGKPTVMILGMVLIAVEILKMNVLIRRTVVLAIVQGLLQIVLG